MADVVRGRGHRRGASALAILLFLAAGRLVAEERLLVGVLVDDREVGTLEVVREEGEFWLPLAGLVDLPELGLELSADGLVLETPLGPAEIRGAETRRWHGELYLGPSFFRDVLATRVSFDPAEYALRLDLPWRRPGARASSPGRLEVEAEAPRSGLSTLRGDFTYLGLGQTEQRFASALATGRVADGWWRLRLDDDLDGNPRLRELAWLRTFDDRMLLVGKQNVRLHPLLGSFDFSGLQLAWTNQPLDLFPRSVNARELLPRRVQPRATFRGSAPPGSIAELRIGGRVVARQGVGLAGEYEFLDTPVPSRELTRIEVFILDPNRPAVPLAIHEKSLSASEFLLAPGAMVHLGGVGEDGNLAQEVLDGEQPAGGERLFYQWRYGLSERWTLEAAAQGSADDPQLMAGFVSRLGTGFVLSAAAGAANGELGYSLELEGHRPPWSLFGRSQRRPAGFVEPASAESTDGYLELRYDYRPELRFALIGRDRRDQEGETRFLLPAVTWHASRDLSLRARPRFDGVYRVDLSYRASSDLRFAARYEESYAADISYRLADRYEMVISGEAGGSEPERLAAILSRNGLAGTFWGGTSWSVGALTNGGEPGLLLAASFPVVSGLLARVEYQSVPLTSRLAPGSGSRLFFGLTADVARARGRFLPGNSLGLRSDRGGLAGRIRANGSGRRIGPLAEVPILLDGRPAGRTTGDGSFFIGNLPDGVYRVKLDSERLPIELSPVHASVVAEVVAGAVTRVDFSVRVEYGIAGRVTDERGEPLPGAVVELFDDSGSRVATAATDRFGLYRIDGLPPGDYALRLTGDDRLAPPRRQVRVSDDFLFSQDLTAASRGPA